MPEPNLGMGRFGGLRSEQKETYVSRDYLKEASDVIFGNKISLTELLEVNPDQVVGNLLGVIAKARNPMQAMIRKAAAYGLGQVGEPRSLPQLRTFFENE